MKLRLTTSQFLITFNNHKLSCSCYQKLYVRPTYQTYGNSLKSYFIWRIAISALQSFCFFTENLAHQPCPCFKSHGKTFFQLLWIYFHMFIHQFYRHPQTSSFDFVDNRIPEMGLFISIKHKDKEQIVSSVLSYFRVFTKRRIQIFIDKYNVKFSIIE